MVIDNQTNNSAREVCVLQSNREGCLLYTGTFNKKDLIICTYI